MNAPILHGRGKMMGAGDNVGNDFSVRGILDRGFEDADDSRRSVAEAAAEAKDFTHHRRIALESARPESIGQDDCASGFRTVVLRADEMAALAPMPSANVSTTVTASPLVRASERSATLRS